MLSLYPRHSLVCNIGQDGSGTHGVAPDIGDEKLVDALITVQKIPLIHSETAFKKFANFNKRFQHVNFRQGLLCRLRKIQAAWAG